MEKEEPKSSENDLAKTAFSNENLANDTFHQFFPEGVAINLEALDSNDSITSELNAQQIATAAAVVAAASESIKSSSDDIGKEIHHSGNDNSNSGDETSITANNDSESKFLQTHNNPENVNGYKKVCTFCGRSFSHPGSLGRHLDLKRGTRLHPADQIDALRCNVKRRGDANEVKARRAKRSKEYYQRDYVKEKNRIRRRIKYSQAKARDWAQHKFLQHLGTPELPPHPSFAYLVLFFLPPAQWPHDAPTSETFNQLIRHLHEGKHEFSVLAGDAERRAQVEQLNDYLIKLEVAYENWVSLDQQTKTEVWIREQRRAAEEALGGLSLFELGNRDQWMKLQERMVQAAMEGSVGSGSSEADRAVSGTEGTSASDSLTLHNHLLQYAEYVSGAARDAGTQEESSEAKEIAISHLDPEITGRVELE